MFGGSEAAAALAHEVKNPLTLIKLNLDLIRDGKANEKNINSIYKEIDRIDAVISEYRTGSEETAVFLEDLICEVVDEYHITDNKRIEFIIESTGEDLCVRASCSKLCILFFNILKNAVEAVKDKGHILIRIERDGECALVAVSDDGGGFDEAVAAVIGRPFVTSKQGGMGLGLTICKKITDEYGGSLTIENIDKGCRVEVRLKALEE